MILRYFVIIYSDRTPERAEFENLGDASDLLDQGELLNSELDEEELTQRNLGATEVQTDDDLEQLSSDDEDEDRELMLRAGAVQGLAADADVTRHLAETWSKKHNQSCCDSDEEDEEATDETSEEESSTEKDEGNSWMDEIFDKFRCVYISIQLCYVFVNGLYFRCNNR